ncbi:hypothetical protein [Flavihumibacter sp. CACIAM 22H1]|uniref:hypothetical protein n=1 Tax=Flavihumibacter sp. CACIAM 22H1 TaxID=1812911 RepID=UPI0007A900AC|nr:hypothetical protein [Flavihumibacter sp. CACIAM 22H1]KYP14187.1 MAG: hypothetical protein A1D16_14485 [Flavihumibacter sp. CACIAM 22H1]
MNKLLPISALVIASLGTIAQTSANAYQGLPNPSYPVERSRVIFHENLDKEQAKLFQQPGSYIKGYIPVTKDETINTAVRFAMMDQIDALQKSVELDSVLKDNEKIKYLKGLEIMARNFGSGARARQIQPALAPEMVENFGLAVALDRKMKGIDPIVAQSHYWVGKILVDCFSYPENSGIKASKDILQLKYLQLYPERTMTFLKTNFSYPKRDSLIAAEAKRDPRKVYDYAASNDALARYIRIHPDPVVKVIAEMASSRSGQLYFPFIDEIYRGKLSFEDVDKVKDNDLEYYRLMVKTRLSHTERMLQKDTPMERKALIERMDNKARQYFISKINGLHNAQDPVRFKVVEPLSPQELYYLCVLGEDEIYTSSYRGVFKRIITKLKGTPTDSLFMSMNFDYFRKFIKMAAAYNELDTLLKLMPDSNATVLMKSFMFGLEKNTTLQSVEDAVDVADAYSSIFEKNKVLAANMLEEARLNYERNVQNGDLNGQKIYQIEKTLFESADTTAKVDLAKSLGIPPVYTVPFERLADSAGRVIQQVFFYGDDDKDGQNSYANFMTLFKGKADWAITENKDFVTIKSTKGKPVWIFANKPLYGLDDPDAKAQAKLAEYLDQQNLAPTIYIHRGHSYHVKSSLNQITPSARIVVLGSCGGYNNLNDVLTISPDAHIISSKQIGTRAVNEPILNSINASLRNGAPIEWMPMWAELAKMFTGEAKERFDDYIPPYKNLGAIFIKAYRGVDEEE